MPIFQISTNKTPKVSAEVHCKGCYIYDERYKIALSLGAIFDKAGIWDFGTCYMACIKHEDELAKKRKYNKSRLEYYYRRKAMAHARG